MILRLENLKVRIYSGEEFYYSAGVMMGKDSMGENFYCHNGGAPGISSYLRIDPSTQMTEAVFINNDSDDKHLADGLVASTLESYVIDTKASHVYYADPKFSNNPEELFQQIAQEAGIDLVSTPLLVNSETTQRYREAMAQTRYSEPSPAKVKRLDETSDDSFTA